MMNRPNKDDVYFRYINHSALDAYIHKLEIYCDELEEDNLITHNLYKDRNEYILKLESDLDKACEYCSFLMEQLFEYDNKMCPHSKEQIKNIVMSRSNNDE